MAKEVLGKRDRRCIFRETFRNLNAIKKNGGEVTDVSCSNGVATFNGSSSLINYGYNRNLVFGDNDFSIRFLLTPDEVTPSSFIRLCSVYKNDTGDRCWSTSIGTSGKLYFISSGDGLTNDNIISDNAIFSSIKKYDICFTRVGTAVIMYADGTAIPTTGSIVATLYDSIASFVIGACEEPSDSNLDGDMDLVEIYNYAMSADEVSLLHSGELHREPYMTGLTPLLEYDFVKNMTSYEATRTAIAPTETALIYKKQGLYCNGSTSVLDTNLAHADLDLTGDRTFEFIINTASYGENNDKGIIISNGKLEIYTRVDLKSLAITSNGGILYPLSATNSILINDTHNHCIVTRNTAGDETNIYIAGVLSGAANQNSGTPAPGDADVFIGNRAAGDRTFDGTIKVLNVFSGIATTRQIAQRYQYWRNRGYLS